MAGSIYTFYTLTQLHAGAGDSAGAIDLPVQREVHTEFPAVYSSGMKGALKSFCSRDVSLKAQVDAIFGKEGNEGGSGGVIFTDAKVFFFPVRSSSGVFKWITSPFVLKRLCRDVSLVTGAPPSIVVSVTDNAQAKTFKEGDKNKTVVIEDFPVTLSYETMPEALKEIVTASGITELELTDRLVVVSDSVFKTLVTTATQVIARNVLDDATKKSDNLWYEEAVPPDALFYTLMLSAPGKDTLIDILNRGIAGKVLQIGGNETVGHGLIKMSPNLSGACGPVKKEAETGGAS